VPAAPRGGRVIEAGNQLERFARAFLAAHGMPGAALAFSGPEGRPRSSAYGVCDVGTRRPVTGRTRFPIASIGKAFTAVCVLREAEAGRIALEDPIRRHLPWFAFETPTVHQLLCHTGGLVSGVEATATTLGEVLALEGTECVPGRVHYSNTGYAALGLVLEAATGDSYGALVDRHVLQAMELPGSLAVTADRDRDEGAVGYAWVGGGLQPAPWIATDSGAGSSLCTGGDACSFMQRVAAGGGVFDAMLEEHSAGFGYGLELDDGDGYPRAGHGGDAPGFGSLAYADRETGCAVAVLWSGPGSAWPIVRHGLALLRAAVRGEPLPEDPPLERPEPEPAPSGVVYRSHSPWSPWIAVDLDGLQLAFPGGGLAELHPLDDGRYAVGDEASPERLELRDPVDGVAATAILSGAPFTR
jgi:CubicO group peptidase (beta-lactamase class C family)